MKSCLLVLVTVLVISSLALADESAQIQEGTELLLSRLNSNSALEQYDVSIAYEESIYKDKVDLSTSTKHYRLAVDKLEKRRLYAMAGEKLNDSGKIGVAAESQFTCQAFVIKDETLYAHSFPGGATTTTAKDEYYALRFYSVPDFKVIGFAPFPQPCEQEGFVDTALTALCTGAIAIPTNGNMVEIVRTIPVGKKAGFAKRIWVFDPVRLLPVSVASRVGMVVNGEEKSSPKFNVDLEWETIDGVELPKKLTQYQIETKRLSDHKASISEIFSEVKFHWFEVNKRPRNQLFEPKNVATFESVKALVDPELNGAISLLIDDTKPKTGKP